MIFELLEVMSRAEGESKQEFFKYFESEYTLQRLILEIRHKRKFTDFYTIMGMFKAKEIPITYGEDLWGKIEQIKYMNAFHKYNYQKTRNPKIDIEKRFLLLLRNIRGVTGKAKLYKELYEYFLHCDKLAAKWSLKILLDCKSVRQEVLEVKNYERHESSAEGVGQENIA